MPDRALYVKLASEAEIYPCRLHTPNLQIQTADKEACDDAAEHAASNRISVSRLYRCGLAPGLMPGVVNYPIGSLDCMLREITVLTKR